MKRTDPRKLIVVMLTALHCLTLSAQKNPYTEYEFRPDTRFLFDYGFCIAMPERMVEDNSAKGLVTYDKGFYDKESKAMLLIDFEEWDGKQTAKDLVEKCFSQGYEYDKKCTLGTKSYAAKGGVGAMMAFVYALIEQDAKQTCVMRYIYPSDYTFGAYAVKYYISESYIDMTQDYAHSAKKQERAAQARHNEEKRKEQAQRDSIEKVAALHIQELKNEINPVLQERIKPSTAKKAAKGLLGGIARVGGGMLGANIADKAEAATGSLMKNTKIKYEKAEVTDVDFSTQNYASFLFDNGDQLSKINLKDTFTDKWSDTYTYSYSCMYDEENETGVIMLNVGGDSSEKSEQEVLLISHGKLYKLSKSVRGKVINQCFARQ